MKPSLFSVLCEIKEKTGKKFVYSRFKNSNRRELSLVVIGRISEEFSEIIVPRPSWIHRRPKMKVLLIGEQIPIDSVQPNRKFALFESDNRILSDLVRSHWELGLSGNGISSDLLFSFDRQVVLSTRVSLILECLVVSAQVVSKVLLSILTYQYCRFVIMPALFNTSIFK